MFIRGIHTANILGYNFIHDMRILNNIWPYTHKLSNIHSLYNSIFMMFLQYNIVIWKLFNKKQTKKNIEVKLLANIVVSLSPQWQNLCPMDHGSKNK